MTPETRARILLGGLAGASVYLLLEAVLAWRAVGPWFVGEPTRAAALFVPFPGTGQAPLTLPGYLRLALALLAGAGVVRAVPSRRGSVCQVGVRAGSFAALLAAGWVAGRGLLEALYRIEQLRAHGVAAFSSYGARGSFEAAGDVLAVCQEASFVAVALGVYATWRRAEDWALWASLGFAVAVGVAPWSTVRPLPLALAVAVVGAFVAARSSGGRVSRASLAAMAGVAVVAVGAWLLSRPLAEVVHQRALSAPSTVPRPWVHTCIGARPALGSLELSDEGVTRWGRPAAPERRFRSPSPAYRVLRIGADRRSRSTRPLRPYLESALQAGVRDVDLIVRHRRSVSIAWYGRVSAPYYCARPARLADLLDARSYGEMLERSADR